MTIAACYLIPEGVVLGADSTTTLSVRGESFYFNYGQKLFEVGQGTSIGLLTWGLGGLGQLSYRTLIGQFSDALLAKPPKTIKEAAEEWASIFWSSYSAMLSSEFAEARALLAIPQRSPAEDEHLFGLLAGGSVGFCIAGCLPPLREPFAFEIAVDFSMAAPRVTMLSMGRCYFWGMPNVINRLLHGMDDQLFEDIVSSGKWTGTQQDLFDLVRKRAIQPLGVVPVREAVDWVYSSIHTTIKAMKFGTLGSSCGGPIEVAVITTDRPFRWVCHKRFDAAIEDLPGRER
jgi:hypothetical protein